MVKSKKKFIDKNNAVTFHLVHRSQRDPLITDERAPQHVLVEAGPTQSKQKVIENTKATEDKQKRFEEQKKFGVFFDDDYNYLQHLRAPGQHVVDWERVEPANKKDKEKSKKNEKPALQLPSSVFASEFEENEGMLRKAAPRSGPRLDWDPEIVAALDDDYNFADPDNVLEDNFIDMAMGSDDEDEEVDGDDEWSDVDSNEANDDEMSANEDEDDDEDGENRDTIGPLKRSRRFSEEETKSRFTDYSISSSAIRRNEQLTLLDDRFEKFYENYDEPEIGALDCDEIEGHVDMSDDLLLQCVTDFKREQTIEEYNKEWDRKRLQKLQAEISSSEEEFVDLEVQDEKKQKFDCESILSTYSNIYNHPKVIKEPRRNSDKIQINPKTGLPLNVLNGSTDNKLTAKALAKLNNEIINSDNTGLGPRSLCAESVLSTLSVLSIRPKDESKEEKRERKRLLREYRCERRIERKANAEAFKDEKLRQQKIKINNQKNVQGKTIV